MTKHKPPARGDDEPVDFTLRGLPVKARDKLLELAESANVRPVDVVANMLMGRTSTDGPAEDWKYEPPEPGNGNMDSSPNSAVSSNSADGASTY